MFCFQCEQTAKGEGCTKIGVCGKQPDVAALQDLLLYADQGARPVGGRPAETTAMTVDAGHQRSSPCEAVFSTLTNVDFDAERFVTLLNDARRQAP
jgi:hydroxylamine reductase